MNTTVGRKPLKLYAYSFRSRAERVIWTLNELDLDYQLIRLNPFRGDTRTEAFTRLNPRRKIPVLVHGDEVFTESLAIMEYLDSLVPGIGLVPTGSMENYRYRNLVYFMATEVEPYLWIADQQTRLKQLYKWPEGTSDECIVRVRLAMEKIFDAIEQNQYVAGNDFSLADIYATHLVKWAASYGVNGPELVDFYIKRMLARPNCPEEMK